MASALARGTEMKRAILRADGGVLSAEAAAHRLGVLVSKLGQMALFRLEVEGEDGYPAFQFTDEGTLPGIEPVVRAFVIGDPWMRVNFMLTGDARLGNRTPIDLLREGRIKDVVRAAQAYGEPGAA